MRYFLDTEFNEDGYTIDLIYIGIVAEDGREFYAVNQDARLHSVNNWVRDNVLPQLPKYGDQAWMGRKEIAHQLFHYGDRGVGLKGFVNDPNPEFWAYYADYDWICLCQLFGTMMQLPRHFPKLCMDLKQLSIMKGNPKHPEQKSGVHNALADARWNKELYDHLVNI